MTEAPDRPTLEQPSEAEINERLNDLLSRWHAHCQGYSAGKGYPSADAVCKHAKTSSVWDGWNGAQDEAASRQIMAEFDAAMWDVPNTPRPWLTALQFQARNLYTGRQVWTSPRLPADDMERGVLVMEARVLLMKGLARRGVLS
jgi:hypothetical protein